MGSTILLVGEDPALLKSRALLLHGYETAIANSGVAFHLLTSQQFCLLVIGQLVRVDDARQLIAAAKAHKPRPAILAIRFRDEAEDLGVETACTDVLYDPAWLRKRVAELLA